MLDTIVPFFVAHFLLFVGLECVSPTSSYRILLVLFIVGSCLISIRSTVALSVPGGVGNEYVIGFVFHASHFLCLAKLQPPQDLSPVKRQVWALNQLIDARWGITQIPAFRNKNPGYVPPRMRLFLRRLWDFAWTCGIISFLQAYPLNTVPEDFLLVPNGFLHRLNDVSLREVIVRVYVSVTGYLMQYCTLRACHSLATCIAMICGQDPKLWPPLFDSFAEAYTVRRWFSWVYRPC